MRALVSLSMGFSLVVGCGAAPSPRATLASTQNPLACAGRTLEDVVPIPELGPLPSGEPVTAGIALACTGNELRVLDWGPDSSASYVVSRDGAMALWNAFQLPATHDERRLRIQLLLARDAAPSESAP